MAITPGEPHSSSSSEDLSIAQHNVPGTPGWEENLTGGGLVHELLDARAVSAPLYEIDIPFNVKLGRAGEHREVSAAAWIFDVDETIVLGSGHHVHDGPDGKFQMGLAMYLIHYGLPATFKKEIDLHWEEFADCGGRSEIDVCDAILRRAKDVFQLPDDFLQTLDIERYKQFCNFFIVQNRDQYLPKTTLDPNMKAIFSAIHSEGSDVLICSRSAKRFVRPALEYYQLDQYVTAYECRANKKIDKNVYSGESISHVCEKHNHSPETCVMVGDSDADAISATLAGVKHIFIRVHGEDKEKAIKKFLVTYLSWLNSLDPDDRRSAQESTIYLLEDFKQLEVGKRLSADIPVAQCRKKFVA